MTSLGKWFRSLPLWARMATVFLIAALVYSAGWSAGRGPESDNAPKDAQTPESSPSAIPPSTGAPPEGGESAFLPPAGSVEALVTKVIDGDTIDVNISGEVKRVRYIGMDTPERDACYFREATERHTILVGSKVQLDKDVSETDRFGRLLRYVYSGDLFVNAELVKQGYAAASTHPPDVRHADLFVRLAREARESEIGLWDPAVCPESTSSGAPASAPGAVKIVDIHYDAEGNDHQNLNDEWVQIRNSGSDAVSLSGWTLSDVANHTYAFPSTFRLSGGRTVTVRSGSGVDSGSDLYWGSNSAVWNNDGDTVTLKNQSGQVVDQRVY